MEGDDDDDDDLADRKVIMGKPVGFAGTKGAATLETRTTILMKP